MKKVCANPECDVLIPDNWFWCQKRSCKSSRVNHQIWHDWLANKNAKLKLKEKQRNQSEKTKNAIKRWKKANTDRLALYEKIRRKRLARQLIQEERRKEESNRLFRENALLKAEQEANEELRSLIEEQKHDTDYVRRLKSDPWGMKSLDAVIHDDDELNLHSHLWRRWEYWDDPTGDEATFLADYFNSNRF